MGNQAIRRDQFGRYLPGASGNPDGIAKAIAATKTDGWASALTGIGNAAYDKRLSHSFQPCQLTYQQLTDIYRGDDLGKRAVNTPPEAAFARGYELVISDEGQFDELKEDLAELTEELQLDDIVQKAFQLERAFGGSAILIGSNDSGSLSEPLDKESIRGIDWLTVLEPIELQPIKYYDNPAAKKYGEPEFFQLTSWSSPGVGYGGVSGGGRAAPPARELIHESRLIIFGGSRVSRYQTSYGAAGNFWGDSIFVYLADILRDFNIAWHSAGILVTDFSQAVFSIENLMQLVAKNPEKLQARMQAVELSRSTARAILIDTKEKFDRQSTTVAGLPDLMDRLSHRLAAAVDIPLSLLFGQVPKGIGNDTAADVRFYYDRIQSFQARRVAPILKIFITMLMRSLRQRKIPKKWEIKFNPLWQLTDAEIAEARLNQARGDEIYLKYGTLHPDEVRDSRWKGGYSFETQIDESQKAPGFVAPLPAGVSVAGSPGGSSGGKSVAGTHAVTSYARRDPQKGGATPRPDEDGIKTDGHDERFDYIEKQGEKWVVMSHAGEVLGEFESREEAVKRLREIEYFKSNPESED